MKTQNEDIVPYLLVREEGMYSPGLQNLVWSVEVIVFSFLFL